VTHTARPFGRYDVTFLLDGIFEAPTDALIHAGGDAPRRRLIETWGDTKIRIDVNCFMLHGPDGISLIDAGTGPTWGAALGHARAAIRDAGVLPEQVDRVLLTHIHGDHALGLLDGAEPWLPRAELLIPEADLAYFTDQAVRAMQPEARRSGFNIAANLLRAYAGRIRTIPAGPVPGLPNIEALKLPGHTPGHTGYLLRGAADSLLIWADTLHLRDAQTADPEVGLIYDIDPATAIHSRRAMLEQAAREGWTVTGSHVSGVGRVHRAGNAFRFVPL
jgi:glyoxylase-like metal-dependent hydrolase (beta-lactamase superfamily II)